MSVSGEKFSVISVVWFEAHFMRKNWYLCRGNSSGKGFLVINGSFIWEIQLKIQISQIYLDLGPVPNKPDSKK